ncbi:DUF3592 domain-containing protein [Roseomonas hellenica]|uniref:DUF3592 domain-containing protein n=1 Tax=Plastoroseomonas hellenica TaxID=2687306 RepID=A0ABS5ERR3_9PROT|nr:DUF3592 domain-containing protein [Plastoroseomonas hellenica]
MLIATRPGAQRAASPVIRRRLRIPAISPGNKRGALVWGGVLGSIGLAIIGAGLYGSGQWIPFATRAESVVGTVERIDIDGRGRGITLTPVFRFTTREGREVVARSRAGNSWLRYTKGEQLRLRYDPVNPDRAEAEPLPILVLLPLAAVPFGLVFLCFGAAPWVGMRAVAGALVSLYLLVVWVAAIIVYSEAAVAQNLLRNTALVDAPVVAHREMTRGNAQGSGWSMAYNPITRFTASDGRVVQIEVERSSARREPALGETMRIRYWRSNPDRVEPDSDWAVWRRSVISGGVLTALLASGAFILLLWRRRARRTKGA